MALGQSLIRKLCNNCRIRSVCVFADGIEAARINLDGIQTRK